MQRGERVQEALWRALIQGAAVIHLVLVALASIACSTSLSQREMIAPFVAANGDPAVSCDLDVQSRSPRRIAGTLTLRNHSKRPVFVYDNTPKTFPHLWISADHTELTLVWRTHAYRPRPDSRSMLAVPDLVVVAPDDERSLPFVIELPVVESDNLGTFPLPVYPPPRGELSVRAEIGFVPFDADDVLEGVLHYHLLFTEQNTCRTEAILWQVEPTDEELSSPPGLDDLRGPRP